MAWSGQQDTADLNREYFNEKYIINCTSEFQYSKTCVNSHSKKDWKLVCKTNYCLMQVKSIAECSKGSLMQVKSIAECSKGSLMQVKSIAECSKGSILQYLWPSLSYHSSLRYLFFFYFWMAVLNRFYCICF